MTDMGVAEAGAVGGLLSVALSLRLPPPGVTRHRPSVETGLSSSGKPPAVIRLPGGPSLVQSGLGHQIRQTGPGLGVGFAIDPRRPEVTLKG